MPVASPSLSHPTRTPHAYPLFHITLLSNLARAYDKYSCTYDKARIPESTYPDRFFLLRRNELSIGIEKASRLLGNPPCKAWYYCREV